MIRSIKLAIGSFFGAGHLPKAPGTWGSLLFLPVIYLASLFGPTWILWPILAATIFLSLWSSDECVTKYGDDPGSFVMDECAGQTIPFLFTSFAPATTLVSTTLASSTIVSSTLTSTTSSHLWILATGFLLFRFFDIKKPLGINQLQNLPGKFGILADDLLAGVYALVVLEGLKFTGWLF